MKCTSQKPGLKIKVSTFKFQTSRIDPVPHISDAPQQTFQIR